MRLPLLGLTLATASMLAACGTTGVINPQLANQPIPANQARLTITRSTDLLYMGAPADVSLDGRRLGQLSRGSSVIENIETGRHNLTVSTWSTPGNFNLSFEAKPGQTYNFSISPRGENYTGQLGWGIAGEAINAHINENTGPFKIEPVTGSSQ